MLVLLRFCEAGINVRKLNSIPNCNYSRRTLEHTQRKMTAKFTQIVFLLWEGSAGTHEHGCEESDIWKVLLLEEHKKLCITRKEVENIAGENGKW